MMQLLGRMEHQHWSGSADIDWLHDRIDDLKEALDMHKERRDDAGFSATSWAPKGS
jgi:hypothetical protein